MEAERQVLPPSRSWGGREGESRRGGAGRGREGVSEA